MRRLLAYIAISLTLTGCIKTTLRSGSISEKNRINLSSLEIGMTVGQVQGIMGRPNKIEQKAYNAQCYDIWYYITEPLLLAQTQLITRNFTPLVFESGSLIGWGRSFYKYQFDIEDEKAKRQDEKDQRYTDDKEEWPSSQHTIIEPMSSSSKKDKPQKDQIKSQDLLKQLVPKDDKEAKAKKNTEPSTDKKIESTIKIETTTDSESKKTDAKAPIKKEAKAPSDQKIKEKPSKKTEPESPCKKDTPDEGYNFWE